MIQVQTLYITRTHIYTTGCTYRYRYSTRASTLRYVQVQVHRYRYTQHPTNAAAQQPRKGLMRALGNTDDVCSLADTIYIDIELLYRYAYT